ncbi:MAG: hypothetical protein ACP5UB_12300 [Candidatus Sumerlaeaceae bacterium]
MMRHLLDRKGGVHYRFTKTVGMTIGSLGLEKILESATRTVALRRDSSPEATQRLSNRRPHLIVSMGPQLNDERQVINSAIRLNIPVCAFITSWDNVTTKSRLLYHFDAIFVWNHNVKDELKSHGMSGSAKIEVVGAPQYDILLNPDYRESRESFCRRHQLDPEVPIVLAALGMANGINEIHLAIGLAEIIASGRLGKVQLLVRPHPYFDSNCELGSILSRFGDSVRVQSIKNPLLPRNRRGVSREDVIEWVGAFCHANVVVHLCSTSAIDAGVFDTPSVCLDFDPSPGREKDLLVKEVNRVWLHYSYVTATGGMILADSWDSLEKAVGQYLRNPSLHREARRRMTMLVAGKLDGRSAERLALAIARVAGAQEPPIE